MPLLLRESYSHRLSYGEAFRANKCVHFPDGGHYEARVDLTCCFCSEKFTRRSSWLRHFRTHQALAKNPEGERRDYCTDYRIPLLLPHQHYEKHWEDMPIKMTKFCLFCDMSVFRDRMQFHSTVHHDQYFR